MTGDLEAGPASSSSGGSLEDELIGEEIELEDLVKKDKSNRTTGPIRIPDFDIEPKNQFSRHLLIRFFQRVWYGPDEAKDEPPVIVNSVLYPFERFPETFAMKYSRKYRIILLIIYCTIWCVINYGILSPNFRNAPKFGDRDVISMSCSRQYNWKGKNGNCGLDGQLCEPPESGEVILRCPALCDRGGWTYSSIPVGDQMIKYRSYAIGGGSKPIDDEGAISYPYRADSYPCGSAAHAGILSPFFGGCVRLSYVGSQLSFNASAGKYGTGYSVDFASFFPSSYVFKDIPESISYCYDPRLLLFFLNIVLGAPIVYLASGLVTYWVINIAGYLTILLALDPPVIVDATDPETVAELFSIGFQRALPLCFVLYTLWKCAARRTFSNPSCTLAKLCLWYPLFWLGVANNITFDRLPVDRLTPKDLKEQPGSIAAVLSIAITILTCAFIQAFKLWQSGRFQKYFKVYITFILAIVVMALLPGLSLRVHHYILAMILLPGTATRGFSAYMFQGILLGLLLSGVARWDFASILETNTALLRDDPGASLEPPIFNNFTDGIISWSNQADDYNVTEYNDDDFLTGYSLLVNDIERYVGNQTELDLEELIENDQPLRQLVTESLNQTSDENGDITLFLRLGRAPETWEREDRGDYTRAGILKWPSGDWTPPEEGLS